MNVVCTQENEDNFQLLEFTYSFASMNCFRLNETTGRNVLEYADDFESTKTILTTHYYWHNFFALSSMIFNALLCTAILRFPNSTIKISSMLLCNTMIDILNSAIYIIFGRTSNATEFLYINFAITSVNAMSTNAVVAQFVYRLMLVKNGEQPRGRRLLCLLFFSILLTTFHSFALNAASTNYISDEDVEDSVAILRHYGLKVQSFSIYGSVIKPNQKLNVLQVLPIFVTLIEFGLIFYCGFAIRHRLRTSTGLSATTKRLNQSMNRTGLIVIITSILPITGYTFMLSRCQSNILESFVLKTCLLSAQLLDPLITLIFIRHYRIAIFRLITFDYFEKQVVRAPAITTI
ncbi:hypothetical protein M3Y96_00966900 [Aphelenchoides besseyi]|nr:hypothetical protein M3Y96_00966900 [Aphelenchoides besseyi]